MDFRNVEKFSYCSFDICLEGRFYWIGVLVQQNWVNIFLHWTSRTKSWVHHRTKFDLTLSHSLKRTTVLDWNWLLNELKFAGLQFPKRWTMLNYRPTMILVYLRMRILYECIIILLKSYLFLSSSLLSVFFLSFSIEHIHSHTNNTEETEE